MKPAENALKAYFREMGKKGGKASADSLSPEDRKARARKAGKASARKRKATK